MNICEIVREWLKKNGYDGLANADIECGCRLDDLMPCDEPAMNCEAGHLVRKGEPEWDALYDNLEPDCEYVVVVGKRGEDDGQDD